MVVWLTSVSSHGLKITLLGKQGRDREGMRIKEGGKRREKERGKKGWGV
jgi:hypothetical protein